MGDPAGVGPELALMALSEPEVAKLCQLAVFGDWDILAKCAERCGKELPTCRRADLNDLHDLNTDHGSHWIVDHSSSLKDFLPCQVDANCGRAAYTYIQSAIDAAQASIVDAVTTGPINKSALKLAGIQFPGHTEMFAERARSERWCMMQYSEAITCSFVTVHVGYADVPALLTIDRVLDTIELTVEALRRIRKREPKIVVCGLNPHAGEGGLFGSSEEELVIVPAIKAAKAKGILIEGPLPPDTAFVPWMRESTDGFICMYHDQGHIPVKALAFDSAVNTTLGLEGLLRTSVDHGTAFDIAWQGKVRPDSLYAALRLASQLASSNEASDEKVSRL